MIQPRADRSTNSHADSTPSRRVEGESSAEILGRFRAWCAVDRRRSPRYAAAAAAVDARVWVGWWDGAEFVIERGRLENLGRGGTRILLKRRPRLSKGQTVWACVGSPEPIDSVEARVLEAGPSGASEHVVRLQFHAPCPAGFFRAAGLGAGPAGPPSSSAP